VDGCILSAQKITDGTPINLGTGSRHTVTDVVKMICKVMGWSPSKFEFDTTKPAGALSRALDNSEAKNVLGWEPKVSLEDGLKKTIDWYVKMHNPKGSVNQDLLLEHNTKVLS
jgi:nucleoside-diphosphate-sugar epimerase